MNIDLMSIHGLTTKSSTANKNVTTDNIPREERYIYRIQESWEQIYIFITCTVQ